VTDERRQCPASGAVWGRTKIRAAGATDDSFGLVLHVCCTQHSFRLGFGIDLSAAARIVAPRRLGEPSTAGSVLTSRAANRGTSAGREHYILLFLVVDAGIKAMASSVSKEARSH